MNIEMKISEIQTIEQAMMVMCLSLNNPNELPGYGVHEHGDGLFRVYHSDGYCVTLGLAYFWSDMPEFKEVSKIDFFKKFRVDYMDMLERKIKTVEYLMSFERIENGSNYDYTPEYFELKKKVQVLREFEFKLDEL